VPTRREVLGLPTLVLASSVADAQPRPKVVGVLSPYTTKAFRPFRTVILRAMRERGYVEDKHFVLVERIAEGINERLPQMAAELVARSAAHGGAADPAGPVVESLRQKKSREPSPQPRASPDVGELPGT